MCLLGKIRTQLNFFILPVHGYEDIKPEKFFDFNDNCSRGHMFKINKPICRKSLRLNGFPLRCINSWNNLDEDIVCSDSVMAFNIRLDKAMQLDRFSLVNWLTLTRYLLEPEKRVKV